MTMIDDDFTEVRNVTVPRVDLVDAAANGTPFLLFKAAGDTQSLMSAAAVEELLKAGEPDMTDTQTAPKPGAWLAKADENRNDLLEVEGGPVDADVPGSESWETTDAATAERAYGELRRLKDTLELLSDREDMELVSGNGESDDGMKAWDLDEAAAAVEFASDVVAVYAASEGAEAAAEAGEIAKALAGLPAGTIDTFVTYGAILAKAGRSLSAANEGKLRSASESIQSVLASLPAATDDITKKEATVADETTPGAVRNITAELTKALAEEALPDTPEAPEGIDDSLVKGADEPVDEIVKADAEDAKGLQPVYDAQGNLVGVVDPTAVQTLLGAGPAEKAEDTPADPAQVGAPASVPDETEAPAPEEPVTKSQNVDEIVKAAVDEVRAETAELVKGLREEVDFLKAPAKSRVFTNGADGTVPVARDGATLTKGAADADVEALIKASETAPDATTRAKADNERKTLAMDLLQGSRPSV